MSRSRRCHNKKPNSSLEAEGYTSGSRRGCAAPLRRALWVTARPPLGVKRLSLSPGILCPDPGTRAAAAGGGWLSPGAAPHRLRPPPPPLLHPTCETGNHKHPSQLCERTYIFSTHSIQHSKKAVVSLKKQTPNFQNNHQSFQFAPHPTALMLDLLARTRQPAASDPALRCPCPARVRGWPRLSGSSSCHGTRCFCRAWGPRTLLPERGQQFAPVPSRAVFWGTHTPRKTESRAGSGCQPGGSSRSLAGAGHSPRVVPGRRGDPSLMPGGPQADCCDGISAAFCRRWGTRPRRGRAAAQWQGRGGQQGPCCCARRGGRSALETSCPGRCLLRHQLGS